MPDEVDKVVELQDGGKDNPYYCGKNRLAPLQLRKPAPQERPPSPYNLGELRRTYKPLEPEE